MSIHGGKKEGDNNVIRVGVVVLFLDGNGLHDLKEVNQKAIFLKD